jgi:alkanesulfonate monooxygenase SsuD/methylene tetrahydromethanopterin reductase-like flavin-dependent oxidoreductase (luciferase family)
VTTELQLGLFLVAGRFPGQDDGDALHRALEAVDVAERAGLDDAWLAEHHFMSYGTCPSALTAAGYALGRTRRIGVGTAVSVLSTAHPVHVAEQALLLDRLSGGRFRLGAGRGGPWVDLEVFGTGLDRFEAGFAESLDLLLDCLEGPKASADGERFTFREVEVVPDPAGSSLPPPALACTSKSTVELAARRGLPMLLGMHVDDEDKAGMVRHYAEFARGAGRDPRAVEHVSTVLAHVAADEDEAREELRSTMPGWLGPGLAGHRPVDDRPPPQRDPLAYTEELCGFSPIGSPEQCAERILASSRRTGVDHVIAMVEGGGTVERTRENVHRLGTEVRPLLRGR